MNDTNFKQKKRLNLIDTHCHLNSLKEISLGDLLPKLLEEGIVKVITITTDTNDQSFDASIYAGYSGIYTTQGIHPHDAKNFTPQLLSQMQERINTMNAIDTLKKIIVAIGEIGLDYHYNFSTREQQTHAFERQLDFACKNNLPVIIHSREADEDMISIVKNFMNFLPSSRRGVFHSFSSSKNLASFAVENGFYLGFSGMITFKSAENVREYLTSTPIDKILFETDSPYLAPAPHRGKENNPLFLPYIIKKAAELLNISYEELVQQSYKNACYLFKI